jgi:WASH complex subunit strumpellin
MLVREYLSEIRNLLTKMIRYVNIKEEVQETIAIISDISYGWELINDYVPLMQERIKKDPLLIIKIRSTFLKLASMFEIPIVRIVQAESKDIESVSKYYSSELVKFVRKTLEIIPKSMFSILDDIIKIQTNELIILPLKIERSKIKEFSQLETRYKLAKLTYEVSKFTQGILAMEKTLMGVIEVDPKKLLEDGVRKVLVNRFNY